MPEDPGATEDEHDRCTLGRGRRRARRAPAVAALLISVLAAACASTTRTTLDTGSVVPDPIVEAECEQPRVTGSADADSYPSTLDDLVADADLVVDARVAAEAGPAVMDGQRQPLAIDVVEVFRGDQPGELTVFRAQTQYTVNGEDGTFVGSWDLEPWLCPGERYVLFLDRLPEGGFMALPRQGALRTDPPPDGRAPTELVESLRRLDPEALRAEVRSAAARAGS